MFYIFLFLALLGTGVGLFPIPEDIIVLGAGAGVFEGEGNIVATFFVVLVGILISDIIIFYIGKKIGIKIFDFKFFSFIFSREKTEKIRKMFDGHGRKVVFVGRFASGFRPAVIFTAGLSKFPFRSFFATDFFASLIYIPILLFLGYRFSYDIDKLAKDITRFYHAIEIVIILFIVGWFILRLSKEIFNNKNGKD